MSVRIRSILVMCCAVAASGTGVLAQNTRPNGSPAGAVQQASPSPTPMQMQPGRNSLLQASLNAREDRNQAPLQAVSYFAVPEPEPRVLKKHDLVTIIVREESNFSAEGTTDLKKQAAINAEIREFIRLNLSEAVIEPATGLPVGVDLSGRRNFKGEGSVDRSDKFTTRITAEIIDVKPNGTIVLQARSRTKIDEEEQIMILSGTCRAEDVTADNTILSTQLFDKDVTKIHKGAVRDTTRRGVISKLLDAINPF
jgi:flagellar L-ring protein FlgH